MNRFDAHTWVDEVHRGQMRFGLRVARTLFEAHSDFQKVTVVETPALGRALLLDDMWMCAEGDERCYHELLVHPAMNCAPRIAHVVIIGGGDGGTAREVLRYPEVERVTMIEIDPMVVEACRDHIPSLGAWDDPRLDLEHVDGVAWVEQAAAGSVDVIFIDGIDPIGPGAVLYSDAFYAACARALTDDGVFVAQSESPRTQLETHLDMLRRLPRAFDQVHPYYGTVSVYPGGAWSWTMASARVTPSNVREDRLAHVQPALEIYNRDIHHGAFAMPNYIRRALDDAR